MLEIDIRRLVPRFIREDKNGKAMAAALEKAFEMADAIIESGVKMIDDVDSMPEWRLDECAWEENVLWFDYGADIETKRNTIRGAQEYYAHIGTPEAVNRILESVFGEGSIEEWFEYGGEPYHYKVITSNDKALGENLPKFHKLLESVANTRSVLDSITIAGQKSESKVYLLTAAAGWQIVQAASAR